MIDSFGYKCIPLSEIPAVIRPMNPWPELPPEIPEKALHYDWPALLPTLREMYYAGETMDDIAEVLGIVSVDALKKRIVCFIATGDLVKRVNKTEPNKWTPDKQREMKRRLLGGETTTVVARAVGVCVQTLRLKAHECGLYYTACGANPGYWSLDRHSVRGVA